MGKRGGGEGKEREVGLGEKQTDREVQERRHTYFKLDKTRLTDTLEM